MKQHINRLLPTTAAYVDGFSHHLCDTVIAAYTAFLHYQGKTELYGEPDEGAIYFLIRECRNSFVIASEAWQSEAINSPFVQDFFGRSPSRAKGHQTATLSSYARRVCDLGDLAITVKYVYAPRR